MNVKRVTNERDGDVKATYVTLHFRRLEHRLERLQEVHHARVRFEIGEVIVHPEEHDARHLVPNRVIVEPVARHE